MITILYFAKLKEELEIEQESITQSFSTTSELKNYLCERGEKWQQIINNPTTQIAVNHEISDWNSALPESAEIALFPPITGG